jgi:hypothetical protein
MKLNRKFAAQIISLTLKIVIVLLLSNAAQTFFVYQNF